MKLLKTFLFVLITSVMALSKMGYGFEVFSDSSLNSQSASNTLENSSKSNGHNDLTSFRNLHHPTDNYILGIDLEEEETEDDQEKKRCSDLLPYSITFVPVSGFTPESIGSTSKFKGIAETQSIRLHLIIEKFQI